MNNFKDASLDEIRESIEQSVNDKDEITLPGLGVFFEVLWSSSSDEEKKNILNLLKDNIKSA